MLIDIFYPVIDDVEIIELKEEDDYEEDTTESWFSGFCAGCFSSNPPVRSQIVAEFSTTIWI